MAAAMKLEHLVFDNIMLTGLLWVIIFLQVFKELYSVQLKFLD